MAKYSGGTRISRPISMAGRGGSPRASGRNWNAQTPAAIKAAENSVKNNFYETGFIFDKNGRLLWSAKGDRSSVSIAGSGIKKGDILTHNHPSNGSFSAADIQVAQTHKLAEIRAVGRNRVYSLRPGKGWQNYANEKVSKIYKSERIKAYKKVDGYINRGRSISREEYRRRLKNRHIIAQHLTIKAVAKEMGYEYRTQKL